MAIKYAVVLRVVHLLMFKATAIEPSFSEALQIFRKLLEHPSTPLTMPILDLTQFELPETLPDIPRVHKYTCWLKLIRLNSSHWFSREQDSRNGDPDFWQYDQCPSHLCWATRENTEEVPCSPYTRWCLVSLFRQFSCGGKWDRLWAQGHGVCRACVCSMSFEPLSQSPRKQCIR